MEMLLWEVFLRPFYSTAPDQAVAWGVASTRGGRTKSKGSPMRVYPSAELSIVACDSSQCRNVKKQDVGSVGGLFVFVSPSTS
ncbi:hypothetical protein EGR_00017 [Echinococcus granulosus]|uniref:Uncharacterized protein n=1 Tax=Echinococcus granulosus TaxID=6210 RepID=W6UTX5_ECHGR|nr:hypothetical protein EGR_00017 [Echinococcus granulosus]EUB64748.1 hypothetical protein EGR_00017 [Echinococcus granulosus]